MKYTRWYFNITFVFVCIFVYSCRNSNDQFSEVAHQFQDSVKGELTLCFYPSMIQLLNPDNDSIFNLLIKDVKKIKVINYSKSTDTLYKFNTNKWIEKIRAENYLDLMQFNQTGRFISVFMQKVNDKPNKFIAVLNDSSHVYFVDLVGSVPLKYISSLANGNIDLSGFGSVLNFTKPKNKNKNKKR